MNLATIKMADLQSQFDEIRELFLGDLEEIFETGAFIGGRWLTRFESEFADYTGSKHAIGVANGTDALELILRALDLPKGSSVVVPANTFFASAEAVENVGLKAHIVDVDENFQIDVESLRQVIGQNVSALILVHLYGYGNSLDRLREQVDLDSIKVVEDCAQAQGAKVKDLHVGRQGVAGAFSFYPGKNLGALGDAGAVITDDSSLAEKLRRLANHGRLEKFDHELIGRNSRLDAIQAASLSRKLPLLSHWNDIRRRNAEAYRELLSGVKGLETPPAGEITDVFHHYVVRTLHREALRDFLAENGVETGIHYPKAVSEYRPFRSFCAFTPTAIRDARRLLSLPVAEHITICDVERVSGLVRAFFENEASK